MFAWFVSKLIWNTYSCIFSVNFKFPVNIIIFLFFYIKIPHHTYRTATVDGICNCIDKRVARGHNIWININMGSVEMVKLCSVSGSFDYRRAGSCVMATVSPENMPFNNICQYILREMNNFNISFTLDSHW